MNLGLIAGGYLIFVLGIALGLMIGSLFRANGGESIEGDGE